MSLRHKACCARYDPSPGHCDCGATHPIADDLRQLVQRLRRTPVPLIEIVPLLQRAADVIDDLAR